MLLGSRGDGTEKVISPWCIWEKCFQLPVLQQHISALMCGTYSLCHLLAKTAVVPCCCRLNRRCLGIKRPTYVEKHFCDAISTLLATQYFMKASTLRCHSQLLARYKEGLIKTFSIHIMIYPELLPSSSLPHVVNYKGTSTFSSIFSTIHTWKLIFSIPSTLF